MEELEKNLETQGNFADGKPSNEKKKSLKSYIINGVILLIVWLILSAILDKLYYDGIEMVLNPEDYYMLTSEDIYAMYGEPAPDVSGDERNTFDMGDYTLFFGFKHGYVDLISYMPDEPFKLKNGYTDVLYLFGLEDEIGRFIPDEPYEPFKLRTSNDYYITTVITWSDEKETDDITVYFKENYPEREVFEDDFSDVEVIYDLVGYLGKSMDEVTSLLGEPNEKPYDSVWVYNIKLGKLVVYISDDYGVFKVEFEANQAIKYINSTQEAMVMFGVDPRLDGLYLENFDYSLGYEYYGNFEGKNSRIEIGGIDKENKTFRKFNVSIFLH